MQAIYRYVRVILLLTMLFNLGQTLWSMLADSGGKRTVWALPRRIGRSASPIARVVLGVFMGWIQPHGVGGRSPGSPGRGPARHACTVRIAQAWLDLFDGAAQARPGGDPGQYRP